jgi:hypothetical protein
MENKRDSGCVSESVTPETVVLVHGIWMTGYEMSLLGRRLEAMGFKVRYFRYHSLSRVPGENANLLCEYLRSLGQGVVHLVGHSLGGIVILHLFQHCSPLPGGRIVLLGSPVQGSGVARVMQESRLLRPLLGNSTEMGLLGPAHPWGGERELGVIAGNSGMGVGRFITRFTEPNDGTVTVAETRLDNAVEHQVLNCGHMGMLVSVQVARLTGNFLRSGRFKGGASQVSVNLRE